MAIDTKALADEFCAEHVLCKSANAPMAEMLARLVTDANAEGRRDGLEEAADLVDELNGTVGPGMAKAIRALKEKTP